MVHPLLVVMLAFAIDVALGDPPHIYGRVAHPVAMFGKLVAVFERALNINTKSNRHRFWMGTLTTVCLVSFASGVGYGIQWLLAQINYGWVIGALIGSIFIAYRSLFNHVRAVAEALHVSLQAAQQAVSHIVGRDTNTLDEHGVGRAAVEWAAENFSDGVVAPVIWFALLGLPGLFFYKAVNTLDSMIGHRDSQYEYFGKFAARLDDSVNAIPARIAGMFIVLTASVSSNTRGSMAWKAVVNDAEKHKSVNAGWPEAAMAGALGLALAGPRKYREVNIDYAWMNKDGRSEARAEDIQRALSLYRKSAAALAAFLLFMMISF